MSPFLSDFLANAFATGLGAIIGIPIALLIARIVDRREERSRKRKVLSLLSEELQHNGSRLSHWQLSATKSVETGVLHAHLKDQLWRAFSDGGDLQWIRDPVILASLSHSYHLLAAAKYLCACHFDVTHLATSVKTIYDAGALLVDLDDVASSFSDAVASTTEVINRALGRGQRT